MNTIYNTPCGGVGSGLYALMRMDMAKALFADTLSFKCKEAHSKLFLTRLKNVANAAVDFVLPYRKYSRWMIGYGYGVP